MSQKATWVRNCSRAIGTLSLLVSISSAGHGAEPKAAPASPSTEPGLPTPTASESDHSWNWQAHAAIAITASAIGSFLVAAIAVYPIFRERKRRREQATNLRFRLKERFDRARRNLVLETSLVTGRGTLRDLDPLISEIDTLGVQADILEPEENDVVNNVIASLKMVQLTVREFPGESEDLLEDLRTELREAAKLLGNHLRVNPQRIDQDPDTENPADEPGG